MSSKFVIKLAVWCGLMLYLLCDLILFEGPLKKQVYELQGTPLKRSLADQDRGIVARVFTVPIYLSQVDYGVDELLWRSGRERLQVNPKERTTLRQKVLDDIVSHAILREKVALNDDRFPVSEAEITAAIQRFSSRFSTPAEMAATLQAFGYKGAKELKYRTAARLQQNKYLQSKIAAAIAVSDAEARAWYDDYASKLATPERIKMRHIFLSRLNHEEEAALAQLNHSKNALTSQPFANLARTQSEDSRSNQFGGELNWMQAQRMPRDFVEQVFSLPLDQASIIETELGWHLVEVTHKKPSHLESFETLKDEIVAALETTRRKGAVAQYCRNLRAQHPDKIVIQREMLSHPWTH